jgi:hypothetical protein
VYNIIKKHWNFLYIIFVTVPMLSLLFWPAFLGLMGRATLIWSIATAIIFSVQNHWQAYLQAECTREKMVHNLSLDLIGLLLTMAAAIFVGGQAGHWAGVRTGLWTGLAAGFLVGFLAAWIVRSVWGRVTKLV